MSPPTAELLPEVATRLVALTPSEAHEQIRKGLPLDAVIAAVTSMRFSLAETAAVLDVPARTMQRWKTDKKKKLDAAPGSRFYRLMRVIKEAMDEFGTRDAALDWLHEAQPGLNFQRPIDMMTTDPGATSVEDLLGRIRHGVYT